MKNTPATGPIPATTGPANTPGETRTKLETLGLHAAGLAHDLNNALTPILLACELVGGGRHMEIIRKSAMLAAEMLRGYTDLLRETKPVLVPVALPPLCDEVAEHLRNMARAGIEVKVKSQACVPEIAGDRVMLKRILVNLGVNALQALKGRATGTIRIGIRHLNGDVVITVHDDGAGMAPEIAARIFDPFFTTKKTAGGTGLGLAVVAQFVGAHGATIRVCSREGSWTTFVVRFRRAQP